MKSSISLLIFLVLFISCSDFLVEEPTTEITESDFFTSEENAITALNAVYDPLGWGESSILGSRGHSYEFIIGDICTDDSEKGSTTGDQSSINFLKNFTSGAGSSNLSVLWSKHYIAIARANFVLKNLEDAPFNDLVKEELQAEVRFVRAYSYFLLVRIFGPVPLFDKPVSPEDINTKDFTNAAINEIYLQIEEDLNFAIEKLPVKGVREIGRANKGAAAAYLSRVIMYQLGTDNTNQHTWQEVFDLTNNFIDGLYGNYSLAVNYAELFDPIGENNNESIFEIQSIDNDIDPFNEGAYVGSEWSIFQHPQFMGGWGFNTPTQDLANSFEANDPRRQNTALTNGEFAYGIEMIENIRNQTGFYSRKAILSPDFWGSGGDGKRKGSGYNIRKFRYADILLMNAEAAYHIGNNPQAILRLSEIRNRASQSTYPRGFDSSDPEGFTQTGFPPLDNSIIPTSGQALLDFIYLERRREFGMEQLRYWDLVRTGRYVSTMEMKYGTSGSVILNHSFVAGGDRTAGKTIVNPIPVFPIPAFEVADWGILQNPGYN
ncbi:RagB/SusD family nutrient uptake outer membrane protein [Marinigracilibium pacificum]|uniref:RagB/SusD family nutrient uptake outer membrane protein n=1 Tax=Marinigracilibium pacificum TaxID=2729599 RepID=A0A848J0U1_9BACT|nr:RagB/SusD family nutrient uptake outer membrane protein [Marinigracilibium pacificum]NMM49281.1 RagB/SusD family nutrient uptake outer membrane protein [Marinigracilibium pacificum]